MIKAGRCCEFGGTSWIFSKGRVLRRRLAPGARAMNIYDVYQPVKNSLSAMVFSSSELLSDSFSVGRVASGQPYLEVSNRLSESEALSGNLGVLPTKNEACLRGSKSPAQHIVEGIEVAAPTRIRDKPCRYFVKKTVERREGSSVDLVHVLGCHDPIYLMLPRMPRSP